MKTRQWRWIVLFVVTVLFSASMEEMIRERAQASVLQEDTGTTMAFREQYFLPELCEALTEKTTGRLEFSRVLTASMLNGDFFRRSFLLTALPT